MGHHTETHTGIGKTVHEAESDAVGRFYHENGHRCSVRSTRLLSSKQVPPKHWREEKRGRDSYMHWEDNPAAPKSEWPLSCEFEINFHS